MRGWFVGCLSSQYRNMIFDTDVGAFFSHSLVRRKRIMSFVASAAAVHVSLLENLSLESSLGDPVQSWATGIIN